MHDATFPTQEQLDELLERFTTRQRRHDEKAPQIILETSRASSRLASECVKVETGARIERTASRDEEILQASFNCKQALRPLI